MDIFHTGIKTKNSRCFGGTQFDYAWSDTMSSSSPRMVLSSLECFNTWIWYVLFCHFILLERILTQNSLT